MPLASAPELRAGGRTQLSDRGASWLFVVGRLREGRSLRSAQEAAHVAAANLQREFPATNNFRGVRVTSARSRLVPTSRGEVVPLAAMLLLLAGIVLLIACANVATLLLARGVSRAHEIGIRAASARDAAGSSANC